MKQRIKIVTLVSIQFLLLINCFSQNFSSDRKVYYREDLLVNNFNIPLDTNQLYFPIELFPTFDYTSEFIDSTTTPVAWISISCSESSSDTSVMYSMLKPNEYDTSKVNWYSEQLFALKEPILYNGPTAKETYRFTWLRTFHNPISIRIEKLENEHMLYWKVCNGAGGYSPGKLIKNKKKEISVKDWNKFKSLLETIDYWNIPKIAGFLVTDGSEWILEGSTSDKYYVVDSQSPSEESNYYKVCDYLIELTKLKIKEKY